MKKLKFPLERSPAMRFLGVMWTGSFSGQIIVGMLLFIGILFMGNAKFNLLSIIFFTIFIIPMAVLLHIRIVQKGKRLMKPWCHIKYEKNLLQFKTGFPNTMNPEWQEIEITDKNNAVIVKGSETGGYHLRLSGDSDEVIRLGLWSSLEDAKKSGNELLNLLGGEFLEIIVINE